MYEGTFIPEVAARLGCDTRRAEGVVVAIFQGLRDRPRMVDHTQVAQFVYRVRSRAGLVNDGEAERAVRVVFAMLQRLLRSLSSTKGRAWDARDQLPRDVKRLWLAAANATWRCGEPCRPTVGSPAQRETMPGSVAISAAAPVRAPT
jgi:uncharacterized protein (DUF2267 family)